jgi:hypothetical protein
MPPVCKTMSCGLLAPTLFSQLIVSLSYENTSNRHDRLATGNSTFPKSHQLTETTISDQTLINSINMIIINQPIF